MLHLGCCSIPISASGQGNFNSWTVYFLNDPYHCAKKSLQIRSFFWSVFSGIWTEYGKIRTRKSSVFGHFSRSASVLKCILFSKLAAKWNKKLLKAKTGKYKKVFLPSLSYFLKIWRNSADVILDFPWKWSNIGEPIVHYDKIL